MNFQGIDHVVLRVRDLDGAVAFWRDVMLCPVAKFRPDLGLVHIRVGAALLDLVDVSGPLGLAGGEAPAERARNMDHVCFRVEPFDPDAIRTHLAAHGFTCQEPKLRFGAEGHGLSIYLTDPEGNGIELKGPSDGSKN